MLLVLYFIGILMGMLRDKSRLVRMYQLLVVWILFVFNTANPDMDTYKKIYYGYYGNSHELGFDFLRGLFVQRHIAFETFRLVIMSIIVITIFMASKKLFNEIHNSAISLMMLMPLLMMVIAFRNSMAIAVIFASITWLFKCDSRHISNKVKFIICVFLAASFHYSALFFLIVLLVQEELPSNKSLIRAFAIMTISMIGLNTPIFNFVLNSLFHSNKVLSWFDSSNRIRGGLILIIGLHFMEFFIVMYTNKCQRLRNEESCELNSSIEKKIFSLNVYSMFLIGFYTFNMEFFARIYTVVLMINLIDCFHLLSKFRKNKYTVYGALMQGIYIMIVFLFFYGTRFEMIKGLFENNALFS